MAKEANKTLIGVFVVGAIALAVVGITIFGSGKFFQDNPVYVMYFDGSINGLTVGAPVEFRGVQIGQVTEIKASFNPKDLNFVIPVYVQIVNDSFDLTEEESILPHFNKYQFYKPLIAKGLRAQLKVKSIITGQLYISVDFYPDKPAKFVRLETRYPEVPTIPSDMQQLLATLQKIPFNVIADRVANAMEGIEKTVNSPEIAKGLKNLNKIILDTNLLVSHIDAEIKPLVASLTETSTSAKVAFTQAGDLAVNLKGTSDAARGAFTQAEKTLTFTEGVPGELATGIREATAKASASLEQMRSTLAAYEQITEGKASIGYDLRKSLVEIEGAARALRSLADYLERHPESILKGKQ
jgi:paraquat-inducible protein B